MNKTYSKVNKSVSLTLGIFPFCANTLCFLGPKNAKIFDLLGHILVALLIKLQNVAVARMM